MIQSFGIIFQPIRVNQVDPQKQHEHCSTAAPSNQQFSASTQVTKEHCKNDSASTRKHIREQ